MTNIFNFFINKRIRFGLALSASLARIFMTNVHFVNKKKHTLIIKNVFLCKPQVHRQNAFVVTLTVRIASKCCSTPIKLVRRGDHA